MMQSHIEILLGASGVCHDSDHHLPSAVQHLRRFRAKELNEKSMLLSRNMVLA